MILERMTTLKTGYQWVMFGFSLFIAFLLHLLLFTVPWGIVGDRIGYRNVFRIALPLTAASPILRGLSPGYSTLLLS